MKYIIHIHENESPHEVRYWAFVEGLDGCLIAEETIDELCRNTPSVIRDFVEASNERGVSFDLPTHFEFRLLVNA